MTPRNKKTQHTALHPLAIHKRLARHFHTHTHAHHITHIGHCTHHILSHCGELILVLLVGMWGVMFANFTGSLEWLERHSGSEISSYLSEAIEHPEYILKKGNLISVRKVDDSIENTFTKWYCTYGAARISPEFFPFIDAVTQQRTRGGNAVNRCENAAATGYRIGNVPVPWALVVYDAWGRFGVYWHVGKVMYYNQWLRKIIVRDMARVSRFTMSDRRDDLTTANVKCYIYNIKNSAIWSTITWEISAITTWASIQTWSAIVQTWTYPSGNTTSIVPPLVQTWLHQAPNISEPISSPTDTPKVVIPSQPIVTPPILPTKPVTNQTTSNKEIVLNFDEITDPLIQHYVWLRDITAELTSKASMQVGDEAILVITIKDKKTQVNIDGLLPTVLEFIGSNDNIDIDYYSVRLISDGKVEIHIKALQAGKSSLIINLGIEKIGRIWFDIQ